MYPRTIMHLDIYSRSRLRWHSGKDAQAGPDRHSPPSCSFPTVSAPWVTFSWLSIPGGSVQLVEPFHVPWLPGSEKRKMSAPLGFGSRKGIWPPSIFELFQSKKNFAARQWRITGFHSSLPLWLSNTIIHSSSHLLKDKRFHQTQCCIRSAIWKYVPCLQRNQPKVPQHTFNASSSQAGSPAELHFFSTPVVSLSWCTEFIIKITNFTTNIC